MEGSSLPSLAEKSRRDMCVLYNEKKELGIGSDSSCLSLTPAVGVWINALGRMDYIWDC